MAGKTTKKRGGSSGKGAAAARNNKKQRAVVYDGEEGTFFEAESIVDTRKNKKNGDREYRVRWKGYKANDDTWEPASNLCESLYALALRFQENKEEQTSDCKVKTDISVRDFDDIFKQQAEKEALVVVDVEAAEAEGEDPSNTAEEASSSSDDDDSKSSEEESIVEEDIADVWEWNDKEQVQFRDIERINVNDPDARRRVTDARESGIPVCLVGHIGWPQFARRWLKLKGETISSEVTAEVPVPEQVEGLTATDVSSHEASSIATEVVLPASSSTPTSSTELRATAIASPDELSESSKENILKLPSQGNSQEKSAAASGKLDATKEDTKREENGLLLTEVYNSDSLKQNQTPPHLSSKQDDHSSCAISGSVPPSNEDHNMLTTSDVELPSSDALCENNDNMEKLPASVEWLDLTKDWEIDVNKMIDDIGEETVPVIRKGYDETNPIHKHVPLQRFLNRCWPSNHPADAEKSLQRLYLHQWQFPLSESDAASKLCGTGNSNPLPNDILGKDLLAYWLNSETCKGDNPFQYLFMGREETMSKLHRDPGGLAISIAPIVGKKEVVLVHRSDGVSCLSHLRANLDKIDLHKFPMLSHARIYKSIISPGEILLMPQGTFHQCRNITPCLSYSRFHLDTVNLRAFLESMMNEDAPEIDHEDVLWNTSCELQKRIDIYVDGLNKLKRDSIPAATVDLPPEIVRTVDALRALRHVCREIGKRYEEGKVVVNRQSSGTGAGTESQESSFHSTPTNEEEADRWSELLRDIDSTLHHFRYRRHLVKPPFKSRAVRRNKGKSGQLSERNQAQPCGSRRRAPLEVALANLPLVLASTPCLPQTVSLSVESEVEVNWQGRLAKGVIKQIEVAMPAALVDYEDLPLAFQEYVPLGFLRMPIGGESNTDVRPEDVKPGKILSHRHGREEYRCVVRSTPQETFLLLCLKLGKLKFDRWLPRSAILGLQPLIINNEEQHDDTTTKEHVICT